MYFLFLIILFECVIYTHGSSSRGKSIQGGKCRPCSRGPGPHRLPVLCASLQRRLAQTEAGHKPHTLRFFTQQHVWRHAVSVSSGCCSRTPQTGWLKQRTYFNQLWEPEVRGQVSACSGACWGPSSWLAGGQVVLYPHMSRDRKIEPWRLSQEDPDLITRAPSPAQHLAQRTILTDECLLNG